MSAFLASAGLFLSMAMGAFPAAAQTSKVTATACERDDYDTARRMFLRLAEQGEAEARFKPGDMYFGGEGFHWITPERRNGVSALPRKTILRSNSRSGCSASMVKAFLSMKLDAVAMARATGDIPQNVNFPVSTGTARAFLDSEGSAYEAAPSGEVCAPDEVAAAARAFAVLVESWN